MNNNEKQTQKNSTKGKLTLAMTAGAVVGGAFVLVRNPSARTRLKETSGSTKNTVSQYISNVKADPAGAKNQLVDRIQKTASITREAVNKIQDILDNEGKEITNRVQEVKEESEEIVSTAKEASDELKEVGDKVGEAKDELTESKEDKQQALANDENLSIVEDDEHEIKKTIKPN
ncbi:hypothetical protein MUO14_11650 [Halobacillus shinanisalinarum]|uniref:Gas vesicle protein n=1 Tax=Halobacillus shinanisalinarum TaxID=2932258 RepID=A0ABY4H946_9BACI|nr:hypothetical protein [Halobacillus shinanisalinarum]UOQ95512.1 hypothetical protein MUO14_11650 [Halobacillus shinanisalinarum]